MAFKSQWKFSIILTFDIKKTLDLFTVQNLMNASLSRIFFDIFKVFRAAKLRETVTAGASCTNGTTGSSQLLTPLPARCPPAGPPARCRRVFLLAFACLRLRRCQFSTMASRNLLSKKATIYCSPRSRLVSAMQKLQTHL